jgi:hypothetical protein
MRRSGIALALVLASATISAAPTAEQLYDEGQRDYDAGNYSGAVARWKAAYEASRLPLLIFNIAQAHRLAGNCTIALESYHQYIVLEPRSEQSDLARGFVGELEQRCGAAPEPPRPDHPRQQSGTDLKVIGLVSGGAGALSLVIGLGIGHHASTLGDEVSSACAVDCNWSSQQARDSAGRRDTAIGYALDVVGIAAIVGASVMYYFGNRDTISISSQPHDHGALVMWSRTW